MTDKNSWFKTENQAQAVAVIVLLGVVSLIIGGLYLAQTTSNITTVRDIEQLRLQRNQIERENEQLKAEIADQQRIDTLMTRAATLGYQSAGPEDIKWLFVDGYVFNQPTPLPTRVIPTFIPESYEENFAGWLQRQFNALRDQFREWSGE